MALRTGCEGGQAMTYIIAEPCINVKDTACVDVCPVDCIHPRKDEAGFSEAVQLYINPDECIDCGACEPACPVTAIFPEEDVPEKWKQYIQINYDHWKK
jgi:NAD-dependent dihydropyrimidine dehydrogenase PreA subunit